LSSLLVTAQVYNSDSPYTRIFAP